jgi:23S rRNA pseudouridine1911/1915/1917 synthase
MATENKCGNGINILYEDKQILVCEKPVGTASQSERGFDADMVSLLLNEMRLRGEKNPYIGVVHRLDKVVGGVMVYAKTKQAAANLSGQIAAHETVKRYYAVICGKLQTDSGRLTDYLIRDGKTNTSKVVSQNTPGAKKAELNYRVLETEEILLQGETALECTLVDIELLTGRHHQIRVQFASRSLPLFGDKKYHPNFQPAMSAKGLALFSYCIGFRHPTTGKYMEFRLTPQKGIFQQFSVYKTEK